MTDSRVDVFGPGFIPGKVPVTRDVASRAMSRTYAKQLDVDANTGKQSGGDLDVPDHSSAPNET